VCTSIRLYIILLNGDLKFIRTEKRWLTSVCRGVDPYGTGGTCPPNIYEGGDIHGNVPHNILEVMLYDNYTYANPLKLGRAVMRQISSQLLSDSHVLSVGFGIVFCRLTPPVRKNSSSSWSRSPFSLHPTQHPPTLEVRRIDAVLSSAAHYNRPKISNLPQFTSMHPKSKKNNSDKHWTTIHSLNLVIIRLSTTEIYS